MIRIGQCNPLIFHSSGMDDPLGLRKNYLQRFGTADTIVLQALNDSSGNVTVKARNLVSGAQTSFTPTKRQLPDGSYSNVANVAGLSEGLYVVTMSAGGETYTSNEFEVCDDGIDETILIEYTNSSNETFTGNAFVIGGNQITFYLRLQGGFKPGGYDPRVEVSTYRTQRQELRVLYSQPYARYQLTIGTANGVPVETVELLNEILSLDTIRIDGVRYVRSEGDVPQKSQSMAASQLFQVTCILERQESYDDEPYIPPTPGTLSAALKWITLDGDTYVWESYNVSSSTSYGNVQLPEYSSSLPASADSLRRTSQAMDLTGFDPADLKVRLNYQGAVEKNLRVVVKKGSAAAISEAFVITRGTKTYTLGDKSFTVLGSETSANLSDYIGANVRFEMYIMVAKSDSPAFLVGECKPVNITLTHTS